MAGIIPIKVNFLRVFVFLLTTVLNGIGKLEYTASEKKYFNIGSRMHTKVGEGCGSEAGEVITCPGPGFPKHFTKCCWNSSHLLCCPHIAPIFEVDETLFMIIALTVIISCLLVALTIAVCCFWSRCPLFNMCRVNYTYCDIIAYSKEEEALSVPAERTDRRNHFSPCHVKMKPVPDI